MSNYVIFADSSCDFSNEMIAERGIYCASLSFRFDDSSLEYDNNGMDIKSFYDKMREGGVAKTSAVNSETFAIEFEKILKEGKDILYLGFSSGLSTTYNSARIAAKQLEEAYPDRNIIVVDTLAASAGIALLIDMVIEKKNSGATIEEAAKFAEDNKMRICHWFTVDDLVYLKRGGRISSAAAFFGNMIGIKPVLHVDNEGHLVNVMKVRGRKMSVATLAQKYGELADDDGNKIVYISHGDCLADAEELGKIIEEKYGVKTKLITNVGTVIGAHSGPGTLALFFVGKER
ncbi:MAG: DegV family protein [Ruminococcaceae bacterium]|nr:DegV family protein [Oscillospiraceae bacterium]